MMPLCGLGLKQRAGDERGDLRFAWHPARADQLLVDNQTRRREHAVLHDLWIVGDLDDLRFDAEMVDDALCEPRQPLAVLAARAKDLDGEHVQPPIGSS